MSLEFNPSGSLIFRRPLIHTNKETLQLKNDNKEAVIFRIKTTAPNQYCFRPSVGRIDAFSHIEVEVFLKPFKADPPVYFQCKDKFLVESVLIQRQYKDRPTAEIWSNLEYQNRGAIHQMKFKCNFSPSMPPTQINPVATTFKSVNLQDKTHPPKMYELATETSALASQQYFAQDKPQPPVPTAATTSSRSNWNTSFTVSRAKNSAVDDMKKMGTMSVSPSIVTTEESVVDDSRQQPKVTPNQGRQHDNQLRQKKRYISNLCLHPSKINGPGKSSLTAPLHSGDIFQRAIRLLQLNTTGGGFHPEIVTIMCVVCVAVFLFAYFF